MKIKSLIRIQTISVKDIYLNKYTDQAITSETFFSCPPQPTNTCPIIDSAISDNNALINNLASLEKDCASYLKYKPEEHEGCNCEEVLKDNLIQLQFFHDSIVNAQSELCEMNDLLELLRKQCEKRRMYGQELKDLLWSYLDKEISLDEVLESLKVLKATQKGDDVYEKSIENAFDRIDLSHKYNDCYCKEKCTNYVLNSNLQDLFDHTVSIEYSEYISHCFKNDYAIDEWACCIESLIEKIKSMSLQTPDTQSYISLYNEKQKKLFLENKFIQDTITPILMDKDIEELNKNTENLLLTKTLTDIQDETNLIIKEFKSINFDQDYEELAKEIPSFFNKVVTLRTKIDTLLARGMQSAFDKSKESDLNQFIAIDKILRPYSLKINAIDNFLSKNGPQIFVVE